MDFDFLIGLITGIGAFWVFTVNKLRFGIYEKKLAAYSDLMSTASILALSPPQSESIPDDHHLFNIKSIKYSFIIDSEVADCLAAFSKSIFDTNTENCNDMDVAFWRLNEAIRADLNITQLSWLNRVGVNPLKEIPMERISSLLKPLSNRKPD